MPPRVLVVEDEEAVSVTLRAILSDDGYEVASASTAAEAQSLIDSESFDVALLDLHLGNDDGLSVLRLLKQTSPQAVALILTGYGTLDTALQAMRSGASDYLLKPCDVGELKAAIARGLAERDVSVLSTGETEQAIAETQQARDDFLELAGRELKTPLAAIVGWAQYAQRQLARGSTAEAKDKLDMVVQESRRAARLVEAFADMVRVRQKGFGLQLEAADLRPLLELAVQGAQTAYPRHCFSLALPDMPISALVDAPAAGTVFSSLLENAAKFSPAESTVQVALTAGSGEAVVSVRDEGVGITRAQIPRIFARYEHLRRDTRRSEGSGLRMGLYLSRALVVAHGGRIWIESPGAGLGSTFFVALPLAPTRTGLLTESS